MNGVSGLRQKCHEGSEKRRENTHFADQVGVLLHLVCDEKQFREHFSTGVEVVLRVNPGLLTISRRWLLHVCKILQLPKLHNSNIVL